MTCKSNPGFDSLSFIWKIENFSMSSEDPGEVLISPSFVVDFLEGAAWFLSLRLTSSGGKKLVGCFLNREGTDSRPFPVSASYKMSVLTADGEIGNSKFEAHTFERGATHGVGHLFERRAALKSKNVLRDDTLTILCVVRKEKMGPDKPMVCVGKTRVCVEKCLFLWDIPNFGKLSTGFVKTRHIPCAMRHRRPSPMTLTFTLRDEKLLFSVNKNAAKKKNLSMGIKTSIKIMDVNDNVHELASETSFFPKETAKLSFEAGLTRSEVIEKGDVFLPGGSLTLACEFGVSTRFVTLEIDELEESHPQREYKSLRLQSQLRSDSLLSMIEQMFLNQKFCDVTFRIGDETLKAHKAVICARSPVFAAMFDGDFRERDTNVIDIADMDLGTLRQLLMYLYSGTLSDLRRDSALKLYSASDKYQVDSLRDTCSVILQVKLSYDNFCDALVLSDMHGDTRLKDAVHDFITRDLKAVLVCDAWADFVENHFQLCLKTLQDIIHAPILSS